MRSKSSLRGGAYEIANVIEICVIFASILTLQPDARPSASSPAIVTSPSAPCHSAHCPTSSTTAHTASIGASISVLALPLMLAMQRTISGLRTRAVNFATSALAADIAELPR